MPEIRPWHLRPQEAVRNLRLKKKKMITHEAPGIAGEEIKEDKLALDTALPVEVGTSGHTRAGNLEIEVLLQT